RQHGREHRAPRRGAAVLPRGGPHAGRLPPLGLARGVEAEPVRQPIPVLGVERTAGWRQKCCPILADTSKMANLYAQVVNRLSPRSCPSLPVIAISASAAAW